MKLKRMAATMMAIMAMATSVAGMSASAAMPTPDADINYSGPTGYSNFGTGAVASIYLDPTKGTAGTKRSAGAAYLYAGFTKVEGDSVTGSWSATAQNQTYCSATLTANNRTLSKIYTYHYYKLSGATKQETWLSRSCTV